MNPEDIEGRDFFVGLRGYDRDEVQEFLAEVASDHRTALAELADLRQRREPLTDLGPTVTAIIRTATESAEAITEQAHRDVEHIRADAEESAAQTRRAAEESAAATRREAEAYAEQVHRDADSEATRLRDEATRIVDAARSEAERIARATQDDADRIQADAERRGRERAAAAAEDAIAKLAEANRRHEELRARLTETSDEIQLALMAMGDERRDPTEVIRDVALDDTAVHEVVDVTDGAAVAPHEVEPTSG
jgi:DivIVA domain-containing protein